MRFKSIMMALTHFLLVTGVNAMDVLGTEPGVELTSIATYRTLIEERIQSKVDAANPQIDHERIQAELVRRLDGQYPVDPMPLVPRETHEFVTTQLAAPMPGAWCVIGHDAISINWLKRFAGEFKARNIRGCFLISVASKAGYNAMKAIVPVPLHRVSGNALWRIHALAEYPIVLVGRKG